MNSKFKPVYSLFILVLFGGMVIGILATHTPTDHRTGELYMSNERSKTGIPNVVTAIYTNYRLYDTILELFVFSTAVLGVSFFGKISQNQTTGSLQSAESQVIKASSSLLFPVIALLGVYLAFSGHLGPGGGFAGGAIAGTSILVISLSVGADEVGRRFHEQRMKKTEYGIISFILLLGFASFLADKHITTPGLNVIYTITMNMLIGLKVFIGTWVVLHFFIKHRGEA